MTFTSYAQNFEDIMLWRALKHVKNGFYIDVGAEWPERDSVTKAFYDVGWCGINIEPNPIHFASLQEHRTRDTNLPLAISDTEGSVILNCVEDTGLSTLDDAIADQHRQSGWQITQQKVAATTLRAIWQQYVPPGQDVHFLKVDVEGLEETVLKGNNWNTNRPWVVVVEATFPSSQQETHMAWEPVLLKADYIFAYADGLNRFYVAGEQHNLLSSFKYPPNVFDRFQLNSQRTAESRALQAEAKAQQAEAGTRQAESRVLQAEAKAQQAEAEAIQAEENVRMAENKAQCAEAGTRQAESRIESAEREANAAQLQLAAIHASRSWRVTAPLRWASARFSALDTGVYLQSARSWIEHLLSGALAAIRIVQLPRLRRLFGVFFRFDDRKTQDTRELSPRSRQIYINLKAAIAAKDIRKI